MAVVTPTLPDYTPIQAITSIATGATGTAVKLDLRQARKAQLLVRIGRTVTTALSRGGYVMCRNTDNDTLVGNSLRYDVLGQTATAVAPTVNSGGAAGTNTIVISSSTGMNVGDILCVSSNAVARTEFARVFAISGTAPATITVEQNFKLSHNSSDVVTNLADDRVMTVEGGDWMYINCMNNSGQTLVFAVDAIVDKGDTIT